MPSHMSHTILSGEPQLAPSCRACHRSRSNCRSPARFKIVRNTCILRGSTQPMRTLAHLLGGPSKCHSDSREPQPPDAPGSGTSPLLLVLQRGSDKLRRRRSPASHTNNSNRLRVCIEEDVALVSSDLALPMAQPVHGLNCHWSDGQHVLLVSCAHELRDHGGCILDGGC